jgi:hypothetical protein
VASLRQEREADMPQIVKDFQGQTVITTFETTPATAFDLVEALEAAYRDCISHQPGFIAAGLHMNDARTRICNYSQWKSARGLPGHAAHPRDARAEPQDQRPLPRVRAGDVRGGRLCSDPATAPRRKT